MAGPATATDAATAARVKNVRDGHERGWSFTSLIGKIPTRRGWTKDPRESLTQALEWATTGNVGLRTGAASGVFVIDVDPGGDVAPLGLPPTVTALTGRGGSHYYFRHPGDLGNSAGKLGPHIDTRGDGGQVVFPGSVHPDTGAAYEWVSGSEPWNALLAELPAGILARLMPPPRAASTARQGEAIGPAYARAALKGEIEAVRTAPEGTRNDTLNKAALALGGLVGGGSLVRSDVEAALRDVALAVGLDAREIEATLRSGLEAGIAKPRRGALHRPTVTSRAAVKGKPNTDENDDETPVLRRASDVKRRPLLWLWDQRIPKGKPSLLAGHAGLGKTLLASDMAARYSKGTPWPDGAPCEIGNTIILSGEDDAEDTLCPRLLEAGADLDRISFLDGVRWRDPDTKEIQISAVQLDRHIAVIREAIDRVQAGLIVFDPVASFLGRTDDHKNAELRALLSALATVARETGCAVLCITHLRKAGGLAIHAAVGSLAYGAAARAVWAVVRDPQDAERRMFLPIKNNLARDSTGLGFRIETVPGGNGHPVLAWESDPISMRADDVLNPTTRPGPLPLARDEAADWLTSILAQGPRAAKEIISEAADVGITVGTLRRAKETLGVKLTKAEYQGPFLWRLPMVRT